MNSFVLFSLVFSATLHVWLGVKHVHGHECECTYRDIPVTGFMKLDAAGGGHTHLNDGCVISKAAPKGFKCNCYYGWFSKCYSSEYPCVGDERCPGNLADPCACQLGGGDCGGYYTDSRANCAISGYPRPGVGGSAECDCEASPARANLFLKGYGCTITNPAPNGWKCVCLYDENASYESACTGWAQQCYADEICLGGDRSYCGCIQGKGDCDGYPDRPECPSTFVSSTCDCNQTSDWSKGLYYIESVQYDKGGAKIWHLKPTVIAVKVIPNHTGTDQSITFVHEEKVTKTSSYQYTTGIQIEKGLTFSTGIPVLGGGGSISIAESSSHTWGKIESVEETIQGRFTCNGKSYKYTECSVSVRKIIADVPYVMRVKHKQIQDCVCESHGVWKGTHFYLAQLVAKELGDCQDDSCDKGSFLMSRHFPSDTEIMK